MTNLTTQQHYEVPGGTLKVVLDTDHALTSAERQRLDHIAAACRAFQDEVRLVHSAPDLAVASAREIDEAIWELGGEQGIMAG